MKGWDGGATDRGFMTALNNGFTSRGKATEREMAWLSETAARGTRSWDAIRFYGADQKEVVITEPDWPSHRRMQLRIGYDAD